jgi:hypothetical protein
MVAKNRKTKIYIDDLCQEIIIERWVSKSEDTHLYHLLNKNTYHRCYEYKIPKLIYLYIHNFKHIYYFITKGQT